MFSTQTPATQHNSNVNAVMRATDRPDLLQPRQILKTVVLAIFLWFVAAMTVRFGTPAGWYEGTARVVIFAVSVPVGWLTVWFMKRTVALQPAQVVPGIAIGTAVATVCDGVALTWASILYGTDAAKILPGAAWILWGVGVIMFFAYIDASRSQKH